LLAIGSCLVEGQTTPIPSVRVAQTIAQVRAAAPGDAALQQAVTLGLALAGEGRFAESGELFAAVLQKTPRDGLALYGAALAAFNLNRLNDAESLASSAVEVLLPAGSNPAVMQPLQRKQAADALVLSAVVVAVKGDDKRSLTLADQAAKLAPDHFDAQFALGRALFSSGDYAKAAKAFRVATALNENDLRARFFLGTALERAGDIDGAVAVYRELIAKQPEAAEGHLGYGILLVKHGDRAEDGIKELERANSINPNLYEARVTLGRTLLSRGQVTESLEHLIRASELEPGNPEPHYQLSIAYRRLGRKEDASREAAIVKQIHESRRTIKPATDNPME
jgi:tetratricopeptide (TPR) repeat protein